MKLTCISCKRDVSNDRETVTFKCPNCGQVDIVRCSKCRRIGAKYKCPNCGFIGP